MTDDDGFRFSFDPPVLRGGPGCVDTLETELETQGLDRAMIICGQTVGSTRSVIGPVEAGLGDRLVATFAETTPDKRLSTALEAADRARANDVDVLVGLGGGSSLDIATVTSLLIHDDRSPKAIGAAFQESGTLTLPDRAPVPTVALPTTLAGADLSMAAGLTAHPDTDPVDEPVDGGVANRRLMPRAVVADPELVATTPTDILAASAMNGFDKGIESLYARSATPITDATATHGLSLLEWSLPALGQSPPPEDAIASVVEGILLVQYGASNNDGSTLSIIHAFGHALARTHPLQQGAAHAVIAPHVLTYLFDSVDGRRRLLADALGVADAGDAAQAVIDAVVEIRDELGLPRRLRDVEGPSRDEFPDVARHVLADSLMANRPTGLESTAADIEGILEAAW